MGAEKRAGRRLSRRGFLRAAAAAGVAGWLASCSAEERERFLRKKFRELTPDEVKERLAALRAEYRAKCGREDIEFSAPAAREGVLFGYALDLARCVGCRRCVYACAKENNPSRDPQIHWIRVLEMDKKKGIDFETANAYYQRGTVPDTGHFYLPVSCQQCRHPPCVSVCPVGATWQEPDGIVVVDYDWCIGCRCCMAACGFGARRFNWAEPHLPPAEVNPSMHPLGNRPRPRGVVEKCTWCIQRVRAGRYPACVEVCPVGARKFGNLLDPESEISRILLEKRVFVLKNELRTEPKLYYYYGT